MSTLFLPLSSRAQAGKSLAACLCAILIASPGTLFAKDARPVVKPGLHFYLNTEGSFGCFSKKALVEHVKHLKMGNGPEATQLQKDDLWAQCFTQFRGGRLQKADYVVVSLENVGGVEGRVVGFNYLAKPNSPPSFFTLIKYVTPAPIPDSPDAK